MKGDRVLEVHGDRALRCSSLTPLTCLRVTLRKGGARDRIGRVLVSRVRSCSPVRCGIVRGLCPYQGAVLNSMSRSIGPCNSSATSVVREMFAAKRIVGLYGDCHSAFRVADFTRGVLPGRRLRPIMERNGRPIVLRCEGARRRVSNVASLVFAFGGSDGGSLKVMYGARTRTGSLTSGLRVCVRGICFLSGRDSTFMGNVLVASSRVTGNLRFSRIVVPRISSEGCYSTVSGDVLCMTIAETVRGLAVARYKGLDGFVPWVRMALLDVSCGLSCG